MKDISGVYVISSKCKPDRIYVGSSLSIKRRWSDHKRLLRDNKHCNSKLQNHYNKHGVDDLIFRFIIPCEELYLVKAEQSFIDLFNPYFNVCPTAGRPPGMLGRRHSEETKNKLRNAVANMSDETRERRRNGQRGRVPWNKGRTGVYSEDVLKRIGESGRGRPAWNKGMIMSNEHRNKLSKSHLGIKLPDETRLRMSLAKKGRLKSKETRQRMKEAQARRKKQKLENDK